MVFNMCCYNAIVCCCELVLTKYQLGSFHSLKAFKIVIIIHILFNKKCLKNTKYKIELNTLVNGCNNFQYNTKYNSGIHPYVRGDCSFVDILI
jgi:hypothetical protein